MRYSVTESMCFLEDAGEYKSYGIELSENGCVIERIDDIDINREEVEALCKLCNELYVSPIHFRDVVDDYLAK